MWPESDFAVGRGDTAPRVTVTLYDGAGNPVDATGGAVTVRLHGLTVGRDLDLPGAVLDGPAGVVGLDWQTGDTDLAGFYAGRFRVELPGGQVLSVPNDGTFLLYISDDGDATV